MKFRKSNYKYQLMEDEVYRLSFNTGLVIDHDWIKVDGDIITGIKGYAWDGCSGPTWDDKTNYRGGLVHDMGYQLIGAGLLPMELRGPFDEELRKICLANGMWSFRADYYYHAVRMFGRGPAETPEPEIIEV